MHTIKADLADKSPLGIVARSLAVESNLSGSSTFAELHVSVDELQEMRFALEAAMQEHGSITNNETSRRVLSIATKLRRMLEILADEINDKAAGDIDMLGSTGFPIDKAPTCSKELLPPNTLETRLTCVKGTVELCWKPVSGAYTYQIYVTDKDPNEMENWHPIGVTSKTEHLVNELEGARFYWFRLTAIDADGESEMSRFVRGIAA